MSIMFFYNFVIPYCYLGEDLKWAKQVFCFFSSFFPSIICYDWFFLCVILNCARLIKAKKKAKQKELKFKSQRKAKLSGAFFVSLHVNNTVTTCATKYTCMVISWQHHWACNLQCKLHSCQSLTPSPKTQSTEQKRGKIANKLVLKHV